MYHIWRGIGYEYKYKITIVGISIGLEIQIKHTGCVVPDIPMQDSFYLHTTMATIHGKIVELGNVDYVNTNAVLVVL